MRTSSISYLALGVAIPAPPLAPVPSIPLVGQCPSAVVWQVNTTSFQNLTREEAVQYLMNLPLGEDVTVWTQSKQDSE